MLALGVNPFQLHFNPQPTKSSFPHFLHRNGDIRRQPILQLSNTFQIQKNTKDFAQCSCRSCNVLKQFQNVMLCLRQDWMLLLWHLHCASPRTFRETQKRNHRNQMHAVVVEPEAALAVPMLPQRGAWGMQLGQLGNVRRDVKCPFRKLIGQNRNFIGREWIEHEKQLKFSCPGSWQSWQSWRSRWWHVGDMWWKKRICLAIVQQPWDAYRWRATFSELRWNICCAGTLPR